MAERTVPAAQNRAASSRHHGFRVTSCPPFLNRRADLLVNVCQTCRDKTIYLASKINRLSNKKGYLLPVQKWPNASLLFGLWRSLFWVKPIGVRRCPPPVLTGLSAWNAGSAMISVSQDCFKDEDNLRRVPGTVQDVSMQTHVCMNEHLHVHVCRMNE